MLLVGIRVVMIGNDGVLTRCHSLDGQRDGCPPFSYPDVVSVVQVTGKDTITQQFTVLLHDVLIPVRSQGRGTLTRRDSQFDAACQCLRITGHTRYSP